MFATIHNESVYRSPHYLKFTVYSILLFEGVNNSWEVSFSLSLIRPSNSSLARSSRFLHLVLRSRFESGDVILADLGTNLLTHYKFQGNTLIWSLWLILVDY